MRRASFLALALGLVGFAAQSPAHRCSRRARRRSRRSSTRKFRELMVEGKFDVAANFLQSFLDSNPTDADFLEIEKKYGTTAFTMLRTVPKWSDDPATEKKARDERRGGDQALAGREREAAPRPGPRRQVHRQPRRDLRGTRLRRTRTEAHGRLRGPVHGERTPHHARQQRLRRHLAGDQTAGRPRDRRLGRGARRAQASAAGRAS